MSVNVLTRSCSYLVLEYVDCGELFEYISSNGCLEEEEAVKIFRQALSAVGYCHSFGICHRDLKPENILINSNGDIRVADFGMAALHQAKDHHLNTSCGSPHYAAPELIAGRGYRGEKVDTWSMGVILFAMLSGRLPFDVDCQGSNWLQKLLSTIRKGIFEMPTDFGKEAKSLIWRMLQVNPRDRINIAQIWKHPLLRKYDYLDDFGTGYELQTMHLSTTKGPTRRSEIDRALLRQLRSLWHLLSEESIIQAILSNESVFIPSATIS